MKRILITGSSGQLGLELNKQLKAYSNIHILNTDVLENGAIHQQSMDITNLQEMEKVAKEFMPNIIINCAAHTAVDLCESDRENAYNINAIGSKNLAMIAKQYDAKMVQISTDYVFDGTSEEPYIEESATSPQSVYGQTKLEGERFVIDNCNKHFIIRTAWLYGEGKNFVKTMLRLAETNKEIKVVSDQFGTPTSTKELAKMILYLIDTEEYGIYHGTCEGSTNWSNFAQTIFNRMNLDTKVIPITTEEYPTSAKRPAYSVLANKKLNTTFDFRMKQWEDALEEYLQEYTLNKNIQ